MLNLKNLFLIGNNWIKKSSKQGIPPITKRKRKQMGSHSFQKETITGKTLELYIFVFILGSGKSSIITNKKLTDWQVLQYRKIITYIEKAVLFIMQVIVLVYFSNENHLGSAIFYELTSIFYLCWGNVVREGLGRQRTRQCVHYEILCVGILYSCEELKHGTMLKWADFFC